MNLHLNSKAEHKEQMHSTCARSRLLGERDEPRQRRGETSTVVHSHLVALEVGTGVGVGIIIRGAAHQCAGEDVRVGAWAEWVVGRGAWVWRKDSVATGSEILQQRSSSTNNTSPHQDC